MDRYVFWRTKSAMEVASAETDNGPKLMIKFMKAIDQRKYDTDSRQVISLDVKEAHDLALALENLKDKYTLTHVTGGNIDGNLKDKPIKSMAFLPAKDGNGVMVYFGVKINGNEDKYPPVALSDADVHFLVMILKAFVLKTMFGGVNAGIW